MSNKTCYVFAAESPRENFFELLGGGSLDDVAGDHVHYRPYDSTGDYTTVDKPYFTKFFVSCDPPAPGTPPPPPAADATTDSKS